MMHLRRATPLLVLLFGLGAWSRADEVKTLAGKTLTGTVTSVSATEVEIKTDKGVEKVPLAQVLSLNIRPSRDVSQLKFTEVRLIADSVLRASKVAYPGKDVELTLLSGETVRVPLAAVLS